MNGVRLLSQMKEARYLYLNVLTHHLAECITGLRHLVCGQHGIWESRCTPLPVHTDTRHEVREQQRRGSVFVIQAKRCNSRPIVNTQGTVMVMISFFKTIFEAISLFSYMLDFCERKISPLVKPCTETASNSAQVVRRKPNRIETARQAATPIRLGPTAKSANRHEADSQDGNARGKVHLTPKEKF